MMILKQPYYGVSCEYLEPFVCVCVCVCVCERERECLCALNMGVQQIQSCYKESEIVKTVYHYLMVLLRSVLMSP